MEEAVLVLLLIAAAWSDVRKLRIPNGLVLGGALAALLFAAVANGVHGVIWSWLGIGMCLLVLLPFYLLRMMGAGDVKLMGMVGAFLGPVEGLYATLATMIAGGAVSLWWLWRVRRSRAGSPQEGPPSADIRAMHVPYGVAILLGVLGWLLGRMCW